VIAKCISIADGIARIHAMHEIKSGQVCSMYAHVAEWTEACAYMKASRSRVFILTHTHGARFECATSRLVEISAVRLPQVGAVASSNLNANAMDKRNGIYGRCMQGCGKYSLVASNRPQVLIYHSDRELRAHHDRVLALRSTPQTEDLSRSEHDYVHATQAAGLVTMVSLAVPSEITVSTHAWPHWKAQGYRLMGASDGSGEKNDGRSGAYAWVLAACKNKHIVLLHRGWGWEDMVSNYARGLIDSTRMELTGIAAGMTFAIQHYPGTAMRWYCDNDAVVGETKRVRSRTKADWLRTSNTDVGMYLESLPRHLTKCEKAVWNRGHPEERMSTNEYVPADWLNECCDSLASKVTHAPPNT